MQIGSRRAIFFEERIPSFTCNPASGDGSHADHVDPVTFSRDGELAEHERLSITASERTLDLRVGPDYEPHPE